MVNKVIFRLLLRVGECSGRCASRDQIRSLAVCCTDHRLPWKYVDDTTIAATVYKNNIRNIQVAVDDLAQRTHFQRTRFQLNAAIINHLRALRHC